MLTTALPFLHEPGMLPGAKMGLEKRSETIAAASADSVLLFIPNPTVDFPNEKSRSKLETAKIPKSGFCQ